MQSTAVFSVTPLLAILVSTMGALLVARTGERRTNLRESWSVAAGILQLTFVASMIPAVVSGRTPEIIVSRILPGLELAFRVDALGLLFAVGASVVLFHRVHARA
jgi:multicomponent Na+:H+ antiporter subunit D